MTFQRNLIAIIIIIGLVLVGYFQIFNGGHFFVYKDQVNVSSYSYGNSLGNGWQSHRGFGMSFFFGDPGFWHPWSPLSLWGKLFDSPQVAYTWSVVVLSIIAACAMHYFLQHSVPSLGLLSAPLSILVVFGTNQTSVYFCRFFITTCIGVPLMMVLLYQFYRHPKVIHVYLAIILFCFVMFLGSFWGYTMVVSLGSFFTILYVVYHKITFRQIILKYLTFFILSGLGVIVIGFCMFYSTIVDYFVSGGYMREKVVVYQHAVHLLPKISAIIDYLVSLIQIEWLSTQLRLIGIWPYEVIHSTNVTVVFPFILIFFLFRRSSTFWEYAIKWLLIIFYTFNALLLLPLFKDMYKFLSASSMKFITMYSYANIIPLQVALIGIFISRLRANEATERLPWEKRIQTFIAIPLCALYLSIMIFCLLSLFMPGALPAMVKNIMAKIIPDTFYNYPKDLLVYVITSNILLIQQSMHWHSLIFYILCTISVLVFVIDRWYRALACKSTLVIISMVCALGIVMSWSIYPLSKQANVWEKHAQSLPDFKPTDRFYFAHDYDAYTHKNLVERMTRHKKRAEERGGLKEHFAFKVGMCVPPALSISNNKSFIQRNVGEFLYHIFNGDGIKRITHLRELAEQGPLHIHELLDMGAVNYYISTREFHNLPDSLSLYYQNNDMYVYKNDNAWPYYYLAQRIDKHSDSHLQNVVKGTAYISDKENITIDPDPANSKISLTAFAYGAMEFDYYSDSENFLVVADAWHPFWKAIVDDKEVPVIKTNEIFKGVSVPKGTYTIKLFFDTTPFHRGIYVSMIAGIVFIVVFITELRRKRDITFLL